MCMFFSSDTLLFKWFIIDVSFKIIKKRSSHHVVYRASQWKKKKTKMTYEFRGICAFCFSWILWVESRIKFYFNQDFVSWKIRWVGVEFWRDLIFWVLHWTHILLKLSKYRQALKFNPFFAENLWNKPISPLKFEFSTFYYFPQLTN